MNFGAGAGPVHRWCFVNTLESHMDSTRSGGGVFPARQRVRIMIGRRQGPRARAGAPPPLHVPHFLHEAAADSDVPVPPSPRARAHSVACAVPVSDPDRRHRRRPRAVHGPRDWARHCQCRGGGPGSVVRIRPGPGLEIGSILLQVPPITSQLEVPS